MASVMTASDRPRSWLFAMSVGRLRSQQRAALFVALALLAWAGFAWAILRPGEIVTDWNSWRQADTQTIALNFARHSSSILLPQIQWGGDGPGYVEAEFQVYTKIVAVLMTVFGEAEWIGQ